MPESSSKDVRPRQKWAVTTPWVLAGPDCPSSKANVSDPCELLEVKAYDTGINVVHPPAVVIGDVSGNRAAVRQ